MSHCAGVRNLFLLEPGIAYLNHGAFGATPREVMAASESWRRRLEAEPTRFMESERAPALRQARAEMAGFVSAALEDLVLVENATAGCNAVLRSLALKPGAEILTVDHGYPAVLKVLRHVAGLSGARLIEVVLPFPFEGPEAILEAVLAGITQRTQLVVLDLITSRSATILPVAPIIEAAHAAGARVLIDAAHAPGHIELDVPGLGADWVTGNAHKWLFAPKGTAFLWAAPAAQDGLHPTVISHGYGQGFEEEFAWTGTSDPSNWLALPTAIDFYRRMGDGAIRERNRALAAEAAALLQGELGALPAAAPNMRGAMASLALPMADPADCRAAEALQGRLLDRHRIEVPIFPFAGRIWLRLSAQIYNELADYERLAQALKAELQ
ncbi:MAG TPA: aminotransferase class V-fold PLP-dependent enzyme [Candidatus Udaeobacter sp.]|nr:aminotransferase class V-fold PLP-dependent enzyme [Candidatus Udaeobacter sp.]